MTAVVCDDADPNLETAFRNGTTNYPGYSLCGLMICVVINMIGCGCLCRAQRDDQKHGNENDQVKSDRKNGKDDDIKVSSAKVNVEEERSKMVAEEQNEVELQSDLLKDREPGMLMQPHPGIPEHPAGSQPNDHYTHQ